MILINGLQMLHVRATGEVIQVRWSPLADAAGYRLQLLSEHEVIAEVGVTAAEATLAAPHGSHALFVRVCGTAADGSNGPWSAAFPAGQPAGEQLAASAMGAVLAAPSTTTPPTLQSLSYDGLNLAAQWTAVAGATSYGFGVFQNGTQFFGGSPATNQVHTRISLPAGYAYTVCVSAAGTGWSAPVALLLDAPQRLRLQVQPDAIQAQWSGLGNITAYRLMLLDGTTVISQTDITAVRGTLPVPADLTKTYTAQVCGLTGTGNISCGPPSTPATVNFVVPPTIQGVSYDGLTFTAQWSAVSGVSAYGFAIFQDGVQFFAGSPGTPQVNTRISLPDGHTYTTRVSVPGSPWSAPVPVLVDAPQALADTTTSTAITAQWSELAGATAYRLLLLKDNTAVAHVDVTTNGGALPLPADRTPNYVLRVSGLAGSGNVSIGPLSTPVPVVFVQPPTVQSVSYDGLNLAVQWTPVAGASTYKFAVFQDGNQFFAGQPTAPQINTRVSLPMGHGYTVKVSAPGTAWSTPVLVLVDPPQGLTVSATTSERQAAWTGLPGVSAFRLTLFDSTGEVNSRDVTTNSGTMPLPADLNKPYTMRVCPLAGSGSISTGPWSASVPVAFVAPPTLQLVSYDGLNLAAQWPAATGATSYGFAVFQDETQFFADSPTTNQVQTRLSLPDGHAYTLRVSAPGTPWSDPVPVLIAAPQGLAAEVTDTAVSAHWEPNGSAAYRLTLLDGTTPVSHVDVTVPSGDLPLPADLTRVYKAAVCSVAGPGNISSGPQISVWLITAAPTLSLVVYDQASTMLLFSMTPTEGITGASGTVFVDGQAAYNAAGPSSPLTIPGAVQAGHANTVRIRATGSGSLGRWSAPVTLLLATVDGLIAGADAGSAASAAAAWPLVTGADAYEASLATDGTWGNAQSATDPSLVFPAALQPGVVYTVRARACDGISRGPWSTPVPGPFLRTGTAAYDFLGRLTQLDFPAVSNTAYTYDDLGNLTAVAVSTGVTTPSTEGE